MDIEINKKYKVENLILGAGGAGLTAAITLAQNNKNVLVICKSAPIYSNTNAAQGGINASFENDKKDDWRFHMYDTIKGSDWIGDQDSIEILCKNANSAVKFLSDIGVEFDLDKNGKILQKKYGGQTLNYGEGGLAYRACCVKDRTGNALMDALYNKAIALGVSFINFNFAVDLIIEDSECKGVICFDLKEGEFCTFYAKNVIIATGGYSQIFAESTSSNSVTGDGLYLVSRQNLPLKDMEFIQFHPTAMKGVGVLISETARSIGGHLVTGNKERFMHKYAPEYSELAPRDIVSRAIFYESSKTNNSVFLDLTHLDPDDINSKLGYVSKCCETFLDLDMTKDLIPVVPAVHYCMGGIPTNIDCQVVNYEEDKEVAIKGLYAIGESACYSVHGANRLGCNSLLDIVVFGIESAKHIIKQGTTLKAGVEDKADQDDISNQLTSKNRFFKIQTSSTKNNCSPFELISRLKIISSNSLGVVRKEEILRMAYDEIQEIKKESSNLYIDTSNLKWNMDFVAILELNSLIECTLHSISAAIHRKESRGSHYREDYPQRNDINFAKHSVSKNNDGNITIDYVSPRKNTKDISFFPIRERNY